MVVSAREEASRIGVEILKKGGNAFDAMMATELALAVSYPSAGNIGGGGFMVYRKSNGKTGVLDYRERAPINSTRDMYLDQNNNIIEGLSMIGGLSVGVPGTIAGIFEAHEKFGTLTIEEIITPVIDLAKNGVIVTENQMNRINENRKYFQLVNKSQILFDKNFQKNDTIKNLKLAATLEKIMINGKDEFYKGETAKTLVKFISENGGIITMEDLEVYEPVWRDPVVFNYDDLKIISMSPPSSGGICINQIFKMIEPYNLKSYGHNSTDYIKLLVEAERRSFADRSHFLGDPDFVSIPTEKLTNEDYLNSFKADIIVNNNQIKDLILSSQFSTKEDLKLSIKTNSNNERITDLFAGNAKPLVKKYDFIKGFEGGYLKFDSIEKNKVSNSNLKIFDFKLKEVPALTKLLTLASLQGIADLLTGEGIRFNEFEMIFNNKGGLMTIEEIYSLGPSISILMDGYIQKDDLVSLRGTLVPATTVNKVIGSIPVIGDLLVGKKAGEGVFGVSFKIKGYPDDLKTTVNPIKTLTPRFITRTLEKIKKSSQ